MSAIYENSSTQTDEGVIYNIYECYKCGFKTCDDDPDCEKCNQLGCMLAKETTGNAETVNTETTHTLCENTDCERYPDDEDFDKDNEEEYEGNGEWLKCSLCDGYFPDNGFNDLLFISEEPNKKEAQCDLCGKDGDIVQMKGTGEYLCGNGCDASDDEEEEEEEDEEEHSCNEGKRKCKTCAIKLNTDDIIELSIQVNGHNLKLCLCDNCFQDKADILRKEGWNVDDFRQEESDAYMEEVKNLQKKYDIKTDKDGVIILPMGSADANSED